MLQCIIKVGTATYIVDVEASYEQASDQFILGIVKASKQVSGEKDVVLFYPNTKINIPLREVIVIDNDAHSSTIAKEEEELPWRIGRCVGRSTIGELIVNLENSDEAGVVLKRVNENVMLDVEGKPTRFIAYSFDVIKDNEKVRKSIFSTSNIQNTVETKTIYIEHGNPIYVNTDFNYLEEDEL